jgi:hypothetical protein
MGCEAPGATVLIVAAEANGFAAKARNFPSPACGKGETATLAPVPPPAILTLP